MGYGSSLWGEALWGAPDFEVVLEIGASALVQVEAAIVIGGDARIDDPTQPRTGRPFRVSRIFYAGSTASFFLEDLKVDGMDYLGAPPLWSLAGSSGHAAYDRVWDSKSDQIMGWQASVDVPTQPGEYTLTWTINTGVVLRQYTETILVVEV